MRKRRSKSIIWALAVLGVLFFPGCGKVEPKITLVEISPSPEETITPEALLGGWYGYWCVSETSRDWKSLEGSCFDCCAEAMHEEERLVLLLWDEDMPRDNYLAKLNLKAENGGYSCTGGDFLGVPAAAEEITLHLQRRDGLTFQIAGRCDDSVTGSFCYTIYLRPWGERWPDEGRKPAYYESWYLPRVEAGSRMPDRIDAK